MNGSGKHGTAVSSVSRLVVAVTAILGLAIMTPVSATASPGAAHRRATAPATAARPREQVSLFTVSCSGPANCVTGGFTLGAPGALDYGFAARWDGTGWTQLPTPATPSAVDCASDSMCMAASGRTLEEWNGTSWQPQSSSAAEGVDAVSCASTVSCAATGFTLTSSGLVPGAEVWNGQAWTVADPVIPPGTGDDWLNGISCVSASDCIAVGTDDVNLPQQAQGAPLAEQWNGQSWSLLSVPAPSAAPGGAALASVSCAAADSCVAVGYAVVHGHKKGLAYSWNGKSWTALPQPIGVPASVSCPSASRCVAAGQLSSAASAAAIAELWNGSSWTRLRPPLPDTQLSGFTGVSCYGPSACMFVGSASTSRPLAELWANGKWLINRVVPRDGFAGLWCTAASRCTAAGGYINASDDNATLTASLSGHGWHQVITPRVAGTLTDISCDSPRSCVMVGGKGPRDLPLAEQWNGRRWRVLDTSFGDHFPDNPPIAVSCASARCLAIAEAITNINTNSGHRYAAWWNGSSWQLIRTVPVPTTRRFSAQITDVSCVSASYCLVVGELRHVTGPFTSFADLWNGTSFTLLRVPGNGLNSISCLSTTFCLGVTANFAVTWNGSSWRTHRVLGPNGRPGLVAVSCASERLCMAVGNYAAQGDFLGNTVALLTGTTWRILPSLPSDVVLTDVSCPSHGPCVVAGESYDGTTATQTFTATWTGSDWHISPAPNP